MALQLTIIKFPPGISLSEDRKGVGTDGVRIGRGQDNDWVLSDPERFLSSKHCQVVNEGDRFFLTDLSTNGTFINGSTEPLGRGKRVALNDGDSFDVGDYRFKVSLVVEAPSFPDDPFKDSPSQLANQSSGFGSSKDVSNDIFMSNNYSGEVSDITPDELKVTDPLQAIDNAQRNRQGLDEPQGGSLDPLPEDSFDLLGGEDKPRGSQEDPGNRLNDAAAWPELSQEESLLPEDWDADISLLHRSNRPTPERGQRPPKGQASQDLPTGKSAISGKDTLNARRPSPNNLSREKSPSSSSGEGQKPNVQARARSNASRALASRRNSTGAKQPAPRRSPGNVDRTLVDAMGMQSADLSDEQVREINETVGVMMRETLGGLMQILRSRASIKNEFRINITTIQPVENNPIKFSANVDEILELMFVRRSKAYKGPVDALQESFNTIADHQLAVIAGIRSAFRSALGKFDPVILQEEFKQSGKGGMLPGLFKGNLWGAYEDYYQGVINDMERSFQELFGDEFVQAYEDQLRKLAHARKREK